MKLVRGQATTPVPWPTHSSPIASRSRPPIIKNLRMAIPPRRPLASQHRRCRERLFCGGQGSDGPWPWPGGRKTKSPGSTGASRSRVGVPSGDGSVLDHRAGPVEAIDQRGADGLHPGLEGDGVRAESIGAIEAHGNIALVVEGGAIFRLHEPARGRDTEDVQVVLDATANEPAIAIEGVGVEARRRASEHRVESGARPVRTGITTVHIG